VSQADITLALLDWYATGERGLSSECIARVMTGRPGGDRFSVRGSHPVDPADLRRCLLLLDRLPPGSIERMRAVSGEWCVLVEHWDELAALFREEEPSGEAPRCYRRMRELLDGTRARVTP
jgi:hypothetical protein